MKRMYTRLCSCERMRAREAQSRLSSTQSPTSGNGSGKRYDLIHKEFLEKFVSIIEKANFSLLTQAEWETATAENFNLNSDFDVDWSKFDSDPIDRHLALHPGMKELGFEHTSKILVFHRGVNKCEMTNRFVPRKINLLLGYIMEGFCCRRRQQTNKRGKDHKKHDDDDDDFVETAEVMFVERENLRHMLPSFFAVLRKLTEKTLIREPTFVDIVTIHFDNSKAEADEAGAHSGLVIKSFHSVPMADLEIVIPHKSVKFQPLYYIQMAVAVFMILFFVFKQVTKAEQGDFTVSKKTLTFVLMCVVKVVQLHQKQKKEKEDALKTLSTMLYHNTLDNKFGVIHDVIDSMEEQEIREVTGTYWALLQSKEAKAPEEIDNAIEGLLQREFNMHFNFEVDDGLKKLKEEGLAKEVTPGKWVATPIDQALARLSKEAHELADRQIDSVPRLPEHSTEAQHGTLGRRNTFEIGR